MAQEVAGGGFSRFRQAVGIPHERRIFFIKAFLPLREALTKSHIGFAAPDALEGLLKDIPEAHLGNSMLPATEDPSKRRGYWRTKIDTRRHAPINGDIEVLQRVLGTHAYLPR